MSEPNESSSANRQNKNHRPKDKVALAPERAEPDLRLGYQPANPLITQIDDGRYSTPTALLRGPGGVLGSGAVETQIARLNDPRLSTVQRQALAAQIGRMQGNRHLGRVLQYSGNNNKTQTINTMDEKRIIPSTPSYQSLGQISSKKGLGSNSNSPEITSLAMINHLDTKGEYNVEEQILRTGTPNRQTPPQGMGFIIGQSGGTSLGTTGGLTRIKGANEFTAPTFTTIRSHQRNGYQVEHFVQVQPTAAVDATHNSYYPGPGYHLRPNSTQTIRGRTYHNYWYVSRHMSALIRQGEQEHLNDALRAYQLTYQLIATQINALAGQRFGPARTPHAALQLALAALTSRLPAQLGTNPGDWHRILDELLSATKVRDKNGWHNVSLGPPRTRGNRFINPLVTTSTTRIGQVPSSQVVNYPMRDTD